MQAAAIEDHALLGDCRAAALVAGDGTLDWLCWPRFDSPAMVSGILDPARGGRFRVGPVGEAHRSRRYLPDTNVLETAFDTGSGRVVVTDFFVVDDEEAKRRRLLPEHELVRLVRCEGGNADVEVDFRPRPDFGTTPPRLETAGAFGLRMDLGRALVTLGSTLPLTRASDGWGARVVARLRGGDTHALSLAWHGDAPAVIPPPGLHEQEALGRAVRWWRTWVDRVPCRGRHRSSVRRSALVLKLLGYAPSGGIVAAPTTSLPERAGGDWNWDYRYCWLRDAAFTTQALLDLGQDAEVQAFVGWLLHATALTQPRLRVVYDVFGNPIEREHTLDHLEGWRGSRPVRVGNLAGAQEQLDVYGEVVDGGCRLLELPGRLGPRSQRLLVALGHQVCRTWREPDYGIWERRDRPRLYTHSRAMAWAALNDLVRAASEGRLPGVPVGLFESERSEIARQIGERAWNRDLGSYASTLDGDEMDTAVLHLALAGFEPASSPRMRATWRRLRERLGAGPGRLWRDETGRRGREGVFGISGFWEATFLAQGGGTVEEAQAAFEGAASCGNDLDLFAEEFDPVSGSALGNFPQAYTHVGLVNAALALERREVAEGRAHG